MKVWKMKIKNFIFGNLEERVEILKEWRKRKKVWEKEEYRLKIKKMIKNYENWGKKKKNWIK